MQEYKSWQRPTVQSSLGGYCGKFKNILQPYTSETGKSMIFKMDGEFSLGNRVASNRGSGVCTGSNGSKVSQQIGVIVDR